jgi:hypothetical protein
MNCNRTIAPPNFPRVGATVNPTWRAAAIVIPAAATAPNPDWGCPMFAQFLRANVGPHAALCESQRSPRLCVSFSPAAVGIPSRTPSCNSQLQLAAFLRSVDYRGLKSDLSPFKINTSKLSEVLIMEDLCRT